MHSGAESAGTGDTVRKPKLWWALACESSDDDDYSVAGQSDAETWGVGTESEEAGSSDGTESGTGPGAVESCGADCAKGNSDDGYEVCLHIADVTVLDGETGRADFQSRAKRDNSTFGAKLSRPASQQRESRAVELTTLKYEKSEPRAVEPMRADAWGGDSHARM